MSTSYSETKNNNIKCKNKKDNKINNNSKKRPYPNHPLVVELKYDCVISSQIQLSSYFATLSEKLR
jgi:hypothetical protein